MAELLQLRKMAEQMGLQGQEVWRLCKNSKKSAEKKGYSKENINVKKLLDNMKKPSDNEKQMIELEKKLPGNGSMNWRFDNWIMKVHQGIQIEITPKPQN